MDNSAWGAIQGITGIGCFALSILTWAGIEPSNIWKWGHGMPLRSDRRSNWAAILLTFASALFASSIYFSVRSEHPRIAWGMIATLAMIDAIIWTFFRSSVSGSDSGSHDILRQVNPKNDEQVRAINAHAEEERQAAASNHPLLTPIQAEILTIVRDLRQLEREAGPAPSLENTGPMPKEASPQIWMRERLKESSEWSWDYSVWARKIIGSYRTRFAPRVKVLAESLMGNAGCVVAPLEPFGQDIRPHEIDELVDLLLGYFVQLENPQAERKRRTQLPGIES